MNAFEYTERFKQLLNDYSNQVQNLFKYQNNISKTTLRKLFKEITKEHNNQMKALNKNLL